MLLTIGAAIALWQNGFASPYPSVNEPDSVYLFSYATAVNNNHNGLHFAWSANQTQWFTIGNGFGFVKSDYGRWGGEKRMIAPYLIPAHNGGWQCVWALNETETRFAHVASPDLVYWGRQDYPGVNLGKRVVQPVIVWNRQQGVYTITWAGDDGKYYQVASKDFNAYSAAREVPATAYVNNSVSIDLPGGKGTGQVYKVAWPVVARLIETWQGMQYRAQLNAETTKQDSVRFAALKPVEASFTIQAGNSKPISNLLLGIFFEDINYAADGGLYAELLQNRDFEYTVADRQGRDTGWNSRHSWKVKGANASVSIDTLRPVHPNNPHYAVLHGGAGATLVNTGYDGITVTKGEPYTLSFFARSDKRSKVQVRLVAGEQVLATAIADVPGNGKWSAVKTKLTVKADAAAAELQLQPVAAGDMAFDVVSLFPVNTFHNRPNGLRKDLATVIADIRPRFVRFPGGCVAHGDGLDNIYRWKNTIGPLEARKPMRNLWNYHQTGGLGYFEYFRFCEDIGAEPLPVQAAGVPCQNSATLPGVGGGQQGGLNPAEMDEYIKDILDLIEYANGDVNTTWGKKRAEAGHPQPFHLKYIGIGNEDLISDVFEARFTQIYNVVKAKHPEVTIVGTVGPFSEGTDYVEGWDIAKKLQVPMVDEHYYQPPGWFINNQDYYDRYDRSQSKVYLGEYAAHLPGRPNNLETALAEALYLTALERNGDVVSMASYAPLLAKDGHTQWTPDLIYFNNTTVKPTVGYEVQKLYGNNAGTKYLPAVTRLSNNQEAVAKRIAISVVADSVTGDVILKMVNLLPVPVKATTELKDVAIKNKKAVKTVLTGTPGDKNARPVTGATEVSGTFTEELPAYSFTVIRLQTR